MAAALKTQSARGSRGNGSLIDASSVVVAPWDALSLASRAGTKARRTWSRRENPRLFLSLVTLGGMCSTGKANRKNGMLILNLERESETRDFFISERGAARCEAAEERCLQFAVNTCVLRPAVSPTPLTHSYRRCIR